MGKMVMKKFFSKENFLLGSLDKKQRIQSLIVSLALILFFVFSSLTFFNMLYSFSDIMGSIVSGSPDVAISDLLRMLPLFLSFFMSLWAVLLFQAFFRNVSEEKRLHSILKDGITILAFSGFNILYIVIMRIVGKYSSMIEGSPSSLYPFDAFLFSIPFVLLGLAAIFYAVKLKGKAEYTVPARPIVTRARFIYCLGVTVWMLVAIFGLYGGIVTFFIYDFNAGYPFLGIATIFIYLLSPILLCVWEFYYNNLTEDKKKEFLLPLAIVAVAASVVFITLYIISGFTNPDSQANSGFGMFPLTFTATANYGTIIVIFTPLVVSIIALIKGILFKVNNKKVLAISQ